MYVIVQVYLIRSETVALYFNLEEVIEANKQQQEIIFYDFQ